MISKHAVKVILLGDSSVGKTAVLRRYVDNCFSEDYNATLAYEFSMKLLPSGCRLQLWDSAGQEKYKSIQATYFRNVRIVLVLYCVNERSSFQVAQRWITDARSNINSEFRMFLVANKCDLVIKQVTIDEGRQLAEDNQIMFHQISAKTGEGFKDLFAEVEAVAVEMADKYENEFTQKPGQTVKLDQRSAKAHGCC